MNRQLASNFAVAMAGVMADITRSANDEIAQLQAENAQLRTALEQHRRVVLASRRVLAREPDCAEGELVAMVRARQASIIPTGALEALSEALKGCP